MKIGVVGTDYVGLSNAILLSQNQEGISLDIVPERVDLVNCRISPIADVEIEEYLKTKTLNLKATLNKEEAYVGADLIVSNRLVDELNDVMSKVYTRDLFGGD